MTGGASTTAAAFEPVIGLEVHVQLDTATKIFCGCSTAFGAPANTHVCPVCTGQPGALPVLNDRVVLHALRMALATRCTVRLHSRFARKNYFYPDLPKGYQISQYEQPLAEHGQLEILCHGERRTIRIARIHLEEDAGKTLHPPGAGPSLVDLNRAGTPLIEIVSQPDLRSPAEAAETMRTIRGVARALRVSDGNMEQGSLRCDANISLRRRGDQRLGTRVEIKNLNSFRFVQRALEYELERQQQLLERGEAVVQQTRLFDAQRGVTEPLRSKEEAHDYRYFPEPDLPPLRLQQAEVDRIAAGLPELPVARRLRFADQHGLSDYDAAELNRERELADYFEQAVVAGAPPKQAANWILSELLSRTADARDVGACPVSPQRLAELLRLVAAGTISGKLAKAIWPKMWDSGQSAAQIAAAEDLLQQSDERALEALVIEALAASPANVEAYRQGKTKLLGFFVGQVMKRSGGKANPQLVNTLLRKHLSA